VQLSNILLILFLFISSPLFAVGGSSGSGGGDHSKLDSGAWFVGSERTIKICVQVSQDFGVPINKINEAIKDVFSVWENYILNRKVEQYKERDGLYKPIEAVFRISFKTEILPNCDGNENLKLYLGDTSAEVEKAKNKYINPIGIAERTDNKRIDGFGKGFIWIAKPRLFGPDNSTAENHFLKFVGVLSHELGHVFGCDHVAGTIMDKDIDLYLSPTTYPTNAPKTDFAKMVYSIDYKRQLIPCLNCWPEYSGKHDRPTQLGVSPDFFRILTGRRIEGVSRIKFNMKIPDQYFFEISDDHEQIILPVRLNNNIHWLENTGSAVFYVYRSYTDGEHFFRRLFGGSIGIIQGQILIPKFKKSVKNNKKEWIPILITHNETAVMHASIMIENESYDLFTSAPKAENSLNK